METAGVVLREFDHSNDDRCGGTDEETCHSLSLAFVDTGSFRLGIGRKEWALRQGSVVISEPGVVHRYTHEPGMRTDTCTILVLRDELREDVLRNGYLASPDVPAVAQNNNRLSFLRWRLNQIVNEKDPGALEQCAADIVGAVRSKQASGKLHETSQLRWYAERIEDTRRMIESGFAEEHSLTSMSRRVAISPFHFARLFRELVGEPPHRYLLRVRLDRAAAMLRDGSPVTSTCYEVGFSNLSHFIRSFRRRFHCSPSEVRKKVQATTAVLGA